MENDTFVELYYAMKAKVEARDKQIEELKVVCQGFENENHRLAKRLHDKNEFVTKLQNRVETLEGDLKATHTRRVQWRKRSFGLEGQLVASRELVKELEAKVWKLRGTGGKQFLLKSRDYWKSLAEKRQVEVNELELCHDSGRVKIKWLRKRVKKWFERARMLRLKEKALVKALAIKTEQLQAYATKNERLTKNRDTWAVECCDVKQKLAAEEKRASGELGHHYCREKVEVLEAELEEEKDDGAFLAKLIKALVGDECKTLTLENAKDFAREYHNIKALNQERLALIEDLKNSLHASNDLAAARMELMQELRGDLTTAHELADNRMLQIGSLQARLDAADDFKDHFEVAEKLAAARQMTISSLEQTIKRLKYNCDYWSEEAAKLRRDIAELRK